MRWRPLSSGTGKSFKNLAPTLDNAAVYNLSGDISRGWPLLVDTGADLSLIPLEALESLWHVDCVEMTRVIFGPGRPIELPTFYVEVGHPDFGKVGPILAGAVQRSSILLGRDALRELHLAYDGRKSRFLLRRARATDFFGLLLASIYDSYTRVVDLYASLAKQIPKKGFDIVINAQQLYLQSGENNEITIYHASNSPQAAQGFGNRVVGNKSDQKIHIGNSFIDRRRQIEGLEALEKILRSSGIEKEAQEAALLIAKAKEEMEKSESPEPPKVLGWLETAKHLLKALALTQEVSEAAKKVYDAFKLIF